MTTSAHQTIRDALRVLTITGAVALMPSSVWAQGPLTEGFGEADPATFAFRLGPVLATPGLTVREVGVDTNVFDEPVDPKRDYTATVSPDLRLFMRVGVLRVSALSAADFTYYREYEEERGISRQIRVRTDLLLSRLRPWVSGAFVQTRDRLNTELDRRARRDGVEYGGGLGFEVSPKTRVYVAAARTETTFRDGEVFQGVDLAAAFNRESDVANGGLEMSLTPFTTMVLQGGVQRDRFADAPLRDSESRTASVQLQFSADAVIRGRLRIGYRDFQPVDPALARYQGVTGTAGIGFSAFGTARFDIDGTRDVEYSFEEEAGYFVQTGAVLTYTQRLFGAWDLQGRAGRSWLDYGAAQLEGARNDHVDTYAVGLGYNLQDRSRLGLNYEYTERSAPARADRRFDRQRIYGSWTYEF